MTSQDSFGAKSALTVGDQAYEIYRLDAVTGEGLPDGAGQRHVEIALRRPDEVHPLTEAQLLGELPRELLRVVEIGPRSLAACHC